MSALVIGESLIDIVDAPGQPFRRTPGGGPLNVAIGLARLGVPTALLTCVGADSDGDLLMSALDGADVTFVGERIGATSTALATLDDAGSATYEFALDWDPRPINNVCIDDPLDALHIGSIGAFVAPGRDVVDQFLQERRARLRSFDPNIRPALVGSPSAARARVEYISQRVDVIKLSDEDASWLYPGVEMSDVISSLLALGPELVALTRGALGSIVSTHQHRVEVPSPRVQVVDTIGAGDAYMSALLGALILNDAARLGLANLGPGTLLDVGAMASRAAAFVVGRAGAVPPSFQQLQLGT
ncbi:carbohydrate kinase [Microbacterium lacus]|uniref:carbohydrate kinase family protein n=1 Tax=Microbacterium lacus TaxID=415217 RepID=UPI00385027B7